VYPRWKAEVKGVGEYTWKRNPAKEQAQGLINDGKLTYHHKNYTGFAKDFSSEPTATAPGRPAGGTVATKDTGTSGTCAPQNCSASLIFFLFAPSSDVRNAN
jgi:hypothetical protein